MTQAVGTPSGTVTVVGKSALVAQIVESLLHRDCHGVMIVGDAGMGKTAVANAVLQELGSRVQHVRIFAGLALSSVPYGALAPYVTSLKAGQTDDPIAVLKAFMLTLRHAGSGGVPILLVIEDAQYLDESTAAVLSQLAMAGTATFMLLSRPRPSAPPEILSMWSDGLLERFDLGPLSAKDVHELACLVLGSHVVPTSSAVLHRVSGGNPMFLLELVKHAANVGHLVHRNGVWLLTAEARVSSLRLNELVRNQIFQLPAEEREVVETVALSEPIEFEILQHVCPSRAIDRLQEANMLVVAGTPGRHVQMAQPMVGEVVRQLIPAARSAQIRHRVIEVIEPRPRSSAGLLRRINWALEAGASVPETEVLAAAQLANRRFDAEYVERAVRHIREPALLPAARLELARSRFYRGGSGMDAVVLGNVLERAPDPQTVLQAALLLAEIGIRSGGGASAVRESVERSQNALNRLQRADPGSGRDGALARARTGTRLLALRGPLLEGRHLEVEDELRHIMTLPSHSEETKAIATSLLAEVLALTGRSVSAVRVSGGAVDVLPVIRDGQPLLGEIVTRRHLIASFYAGDLDRISAFLRNHVGSASNGLIYLGGSIHLAEAMVDLCRGQMSAALAKFLPAIEVLRLRDPANDLPFALAASSYAASVADRRDLVEANLGAFQNGPDCPDQPMSLMARAYAAAARSSLFGTRRAINELTTVADEAANAGLLSVELAVVLLALRLGDVQMAPRLVSVSERCEGSVAAFALRYGRALMVKDGASLLALSASAAEDGRLLSACECARHAVKILEASGSRSQVQEAQKLLKRFSSALMDAGLPVLVGSPELEKLTEREKEIATLVRNGISNREIAVQLTVSLRTVEGHLYRMFAKLGISHREELATVGQHPQPQ